MKIYTTGEVSKIIGTSTVTVRNEIERGNLIAFKVGTDYRITQERLDQYMGIDLSWEKEKEMLLTKMNELEEKISKYTDLARQIADL